MPTQPQAVDVVGNHLATAQKSEPKMKKITLNGLTVGLVVLFSSCKTYYIPVDSFKQQFKGLDSSKLKEVTTRGPVGDKVKYLAYPIAFIKCVDKNGNAFELKNSPSIEIRFTYNSNRRTIFYFDLLRVTDSTITGGLSRIIGTYRKTIPLSTVTKIEVQDGRKNYKYAD